MREGGRQEVLWRRYTLAILQVYPTKIGVGEGRLLIWWVEYSLGVFYIYSHLGGGGEKAEIYFRLFLYTSANWSGGWKVELRFWWGAVYCISVVLYGL